MRLPAFDYSKMAWDAWNAFHVVHKNYAFIQFDTAAAYARAAAKLHGKFARTH